MSELATFMFDGSRAEVFDLLDDAKIGKIDNNAHIVLTRIKNS